MTSGVGKTHRPACRVAIIGTFEGTAFVDVTDGYNPVYLGTLESELPGNFGNIWGDVRVYNNHAYIGTEAATFHDGELIGFGLQIVDLTQFRGQTSPITIQKANVITDFTQSHNLSLNTDSGRLYVAGAWAGLDVCQLYPAPFDGDGGSIVYDLSDPANPVHIGCLDQEASPRRSVRLRWLQPRSAVRDVSRPGRAVPRFGDLHQLQ